MPRPDLMALTPDDLATLGNRGLVKRAQQELSGGELTWEIEEDDTGNVICRWSDGIECSLPAGVLLTNGRCTCPATTLCRHLIRSVLAYQRQLWALGSGLWVGDGLPEHEETSASPPPRLNPEPRAQRPEPGAQRPWDPGAIPDEELARHARRGVLERARRLFEEGQVVDLVRSAKPGARIHTLSCHVRFLVPGDVRYARCDCAEPAPCLHALLAVWAFRRLAPDCAAGLLTTHTAPLPVPVPLLDDVESLLEEMAATGVAGASDAALARARRLEARCRAEGLLWPAEILAEIGQQYACYGTHDARFSPVRVADLVGELCLRADAIRSDTGAAPALFLRGTGVEAETEVGGARLVGLGCGARVQPGGVELATYLQDLGSGAVVAVCREFPDPKEDAASANPGTSRAAPAPRDFSELASTVVSRGITLAALGSGQLLAKGGRRTANGRFILGRAAATLNPQSFQWESLRAPVLVEGYAEHLDRLAALPPAALRPRRLGEDVHVLAVAGVEAVIFSPVEQATLALLRDAEGDAALLVHPFHARGRQGAEALLVALRERPEALRFVAGHVRAFTGAGRERGGPCLRVSPVSLVFEHEGSRRMLQPWIERQLPAPGSRLPAEDEGTPHTGLSPFAFAGSRELGAGSQFPAEVMDALGELLLLGLRRADGAVTRRWEELQRHGSALGFDRLLRPIARLADALAAKQHELRWEPQPAARALLATAALTRLALDDAGE